MLEPIVQIVHYSDIHLRSDSYLQQRSALARLQRCLPAHWRQGLGAADRAALAAFRQFLERHLSQDPAWRQRPTWLVDTGDGTTFGDAEALNEWVQVWSPRFLRAMGPAARQVMLYGNHDAWPGSLPLAQPGLMAAKRDQLRRRWFRQTWPMPPLTADIPGLAGGRVELYMANTVDHRALHCALAWGVAAPDRWWEPRPAMVGPTPADDIRRVARTFADDGRGAHLRILATHYPIGDASQAGSFFEVLRNRAEFAQALATRQDVGHPMVHLLLSGHTHRTFPDIGQWPGTHRDARHEPLHAGTLQSQCGSLGQRPVGGGTSAPSPTMDHAEACRALFPYQATLLRLYGNRDAPRTLTLERITLGRQASGPFGLLPVAPGSTEVAERMTVVL